MYVQQCLVEMQEDGQIHNKLFIGSDKQDCCLSDPIKSLLCIDCLPAFQIDTFLSPCEYFSISIPDDGIRPKHVEYL